MVILLVSECQANPLAMTAEGDLAEDFTRSKHIKNLLRAVQFHHSKSASFPVPITQAQEGELAQAWKAVEICIEQLRKRSEKFLLIQALHELGNLLYADGNLGEAETCRRL